MIKERPELKRFVPPSDMNADDKMNVDAGRRLCHPEVIKSIQDPGLKQILQLLKDFIEAFENDDLSIVEKCIKVTILKSVYMCQMSE